jgi:photosystem II stability/assembly factor-like uncharacterized protein
MSKRYAPWVILIGAIGWFAPACSKDDGDDDGDDDSTTDNAYWYVGKDGAMFRVNEHGGTPSTYPLESDADLLAIACRGADEAWVVGERGTVLFTLDGGRQWSQLEPPSDESFVAVAVDGAQSVWIAGDEGAILHTKDAGESWQWLATQAVPWTGISSRADGHAVLLSAADGSIWRHDGEGPTRVHAGDDALADVWMTPDGVVAVAVGSEGTMLETRDGAATWTQLPIPTARDLEAVYVSADGDAIFAVGEAGVVVVQDDRGLIVRELLPADLSLRDLHVTADHVGHALGDAGTALLTHDAGETWAPIDLGTLADLTALDQLHGEPHL